MRIKSTSKAMINKCAKIGSPLRSPFSKIKDCVVFPPFMTRFLFVGYGFNPPDKYFPKTVFFKDLN